MPKIELVALKYIFVELLKCKSKLKAIINVGVSLEEKALRQRTESLDEPLDKQLCTLRKKSVETSYSIVERTAVMILLRKALMMSGTCGVSMLLTASFLNITSVFFYHIYS